MLPRVVRALTRSAAAIVLLGLGFAAIGTATASGLPQVDSGRIERLDGLEFGSLAPRPVDVWLPDGIPEGQRLAVVYMHDGQMLFDATRTWNGQEWRVDEVAGQLIGSGATRPFMVVAIHNGGDARHAEYFPQKALAHLTEDGVRHHSSFQREPGRPMFAIPPAADAYLRFIVEQLKPEIDRRYPTRPNPEHTVVMGSSMGGLISLYALSEYPDVFGAAACLSTHWPGGWDLESPELADALLRQFQQTLPAAGSHRLYFDFGNATLDAWYPPLQKRMDGILREKGYGEGDWTTRFFEGAEHSEQAWAARLDQPLRFLLPPKTP